jgi:hypothetical protein
MLQQPSRRGPADLPALIKVDATTGKLAKLAQTRWGDIRIDAVEVESSRGVFVPAWVYLPAKPKSLLMVLEPQGRNTNWQEDGPYHQIALKGVAVCAFDVRGVGDLAPEVGRGNPGNTRPRSEEDAYAWASMMLGRPLLGQRVADILAMASAMRDYGVPIRLAARDRMTVPALFALALERDLAGGFLTGGLTSYSSILEQEQYKEPFANFLPGILRHTDLPELRTSIGARLTEGKYWDDVITWCLQ